MLNRRTFLKQSSFIPVLATGGLAPNFLSGKTAPDAGDLSSDPYRYRIGLNAFSFSKDLGSFRKGKEGMSIFDLLEYCADPAHLFDAVDITAYYFPDYSADEVTVPPRKFINEVKRRAFDLGLPICGTGIGNSFTGIPFDREGKNGIVFSTDEGGDRSKAANEVKRIKAWTEVAAQLGAPVLRIFSGLEPSYLMKQNISPNDPNKAEKAKRLSVWRKEALKWMVEDLHEVTEYAAQMGVILGMQNHGDFLKTAEETIELLQAVGSEWLGVIVDTGYFLTADPYEDVEKIMPHAVNFQIKEHVRVSPTEYMQAEFQPIDLDRLMKIVRQSGYRGYLPIETVSAGKTEPYDAHLEVPPFLARVRNAERKSSRL